MLSWKNLLKFKGLCYIISLYTIFVAKEIGKRKKLNFLLRKELDAVGATNNLRGLAENIELSKADYTMIPQKSQGQTKEGRP